MKDQYVGDVNDYRKYGLLRVLQQVTGMRLGICWMKTPDDHVIKDGKKLTYLRNAKNESQYDPALFKALYDVVKVKKERRIDVVLRTGILGKAISFGDIVPDDAEGRSLYLNRSLSSLRDAEIIFFDPDNGIEVKSKPYGSKNSSKYVYLTELEQFYTHGHSLLIYQHFPRVKRDEYIGERVKQLQERLQCGAILSIQSANVVFFLVSSKKRPLYLTSITERLTVQWRKEFTCKTY